MEEKSILLVKETKADERRVALIPGDVSELISLGYQVFVEHDAGKGAGFEDSDYQRNGAFIRYLDNINISAYQKLFENIDIVIRAKRPDRNREVLENRAIKAGSIMIGALDPQERNSSHIDEYHKRGICAYSLDQLELPAEHPMNILSAMSKIAGRLALLDAIQKHQLKANNVVIIGAGTVGFAALEEAINQNLNTTVLVTNSDQEARAKKLGAKTIYFDKEASLADQQKLIKEIVADADIIITGARKANQKAPILIPSTTLSEMKNGAVIVDMALSEGGNVEGSAHDETIKLANGVVITNVSGYPKAMPHESSKLWSKASVLFINALTNNRLSISKL
ncbi:MAG: alanine dehydrogenase [Gammaproteobacteria bacterium]|nr:MAG: alanine dehydrogenase [Gammaproteobacteria bacterium]UTW43815.1 alanine dehydrogenase [bacterium SCSIO 12844]